MPLESAVHINDLVPTNPAGTDNRMQGDEHLRMLKQVLKTDLPLTTPATATGIAVLTAANEAAARATLGAPSSQYFHAQDQKSSGTGGGTSVAGDQTRTLNTVVRNTLTGASLASNQITLTAGTYRVSASAPAYASNGHRLRLRNITDSVNTLIGTPEYNTAASGVQTRSFANGEFVITGTKVFELKHIINTAFAGSGLGGGLATDGLTEVFAEIEIERIA